MDSPADDVTNRTSVQRSPAADFAIDVLLVAVCWVAPAVVLEAILRAGLVSRPWLGGPLLFFPLVPALRGLMARSGVNLYGKSRAPRGIWPGSVAVLTVAMWWSGMLPTSATSLLWPMRAAGLICGVSGIQYVRWRAASGTGGVLSRGRTAQKWVAVVTWLAAIAMFAVMMALPRPGS